MEISFPHIIRTLAPAQAFTVVVTAYIEREDGPAEIGYEIPLGISGEAMALLALQHYEILERSWEVWRERRTEIRLERVAGGIAGLEPAEAG